MDNNDKNASVGQVYIPGALQVKRPNAVRTTFLAGPYQQEGALPSGSGRLQTPAQAARADSMLNFFAATTVSPTKINRTTICAIKNGGSVCVGAIAFKAGTFRKACTTATKTLRYRAIK